MVICLVVIAGFAGLGFDLAGARYTRLQLQNATDAASHAALVQLGATGSAVLARQAAISVAAQNVVGGKPLTLRTQDVALGGWNFTTRAFVNGVTPSNAVSIAAARSTRSGADGPIPTTFSRILGFSTINITDAAVTAYRIRSLVIAQDITGSFADSIDQASAADVALLDAMHGFNVASDRIGMQVFTGASTLFTPLTNVQTGYNAVRSQWVGDGKSTSDPTKAAGLTVCNKLDLDPTSPAPYDHAWVPPCSSGGDGTNPGAAIQAAANQLLANTQAYETRVIVLISDGQPTCCTMVAGAVHCDGTTACSLDRAQNGVDMANAAAAAGISIFTVSFGADPDQAAYLASLARGFGTAYNTPDPAQLSTILTAIAGAVPIAFGR